MDPSTVSITAEHNHLSSLPPGCCTNPLSYFQSSSILRSDDWARSFTALNNGTSRRRCLRTHRSCIDGRRGGHVRRQWLLTGQAPCPPRHAHFCHESMWGMSPIPSIDSTARYSMRTLGHGGATPKPNDVLARRSRPQRASDWIRLLRLRAGAGHLAPAANVHGVRLRRLLRFVQEQACHPAFPHDAASHRPLHRTRRTMGLVLH
jgi:hypothetical protein